MNELLEMPEHQLYDQLQGFNTSIYIFDKNFEALEEPINFLIGDPRADSLIWDSDKRNQLKTIQLDIIRRLYNFVQSAMSLVAHSRNLYKKLYLDTERFPEYQARVDQDFTKDPLSKFVQDLRRYCHHYKAPNLRVRVTVTQEAGQQIEKKTVELLVEDLKTFPDWTSLAKKYLNSVDEAVEILEVATTYRNKVLQFYEWFQSRQTEIHAKEFERYREKQRQIFLLMLEQKIGGCFENRENMPFRKEEIFQEIFTANEFEELEKIDPISPERAKRAIELAEKHFLIPDAIKQKIIHLYQEPGFLASRNFEAGERSEE